MEQGDDWHSSTSEERRVVALKILRRVIKLRGDTFRLC